MKIKRLVNAEGKQSSFQQSFEDVK